MLRCPTCRARVPDVPETGEAVCPACHERFTPDDEPEAPRSKAPKKKRWERELEDYENDERDARRRFGTQREARERVLVPAIGLMVTGGLGLIALIGVLTLVLPGWGGGGMNRLAFVIVFLSLAWPFVLAHAGWELLNLGRREYIGYGVILAMLPCNPLVPLGWVFGIWTITLLRDRRIQRHLRE